MFARPLFLFLALAALSFSATVVTVVSPQAGEVRNSDIVDAGAIGPGQTLSIQVDREVNTGGIHGTGGRMDLAVANNLPPRVGIPAQRTLPAAAPPDGHRKP